MAERKIVQMQELNKNTKEVVANQMPQTLAEAVLYTNAEPMVRDRKSTRLNSSHGEQSRMPSSA